ncbi:nuclease-related domain-containing DEAD/DEAH box helicase [Priestia aryabhattai]|uniref:nuclease-related domain-containing DEAD/DEAH box helicase n=1 Tax=Priestia aryabhattai TaxID=412384 RepID=UPI0021AD9E2B|nr:NERD domain-containing protein [Priestia aryabhattai]
MIPDYIHEDCNSTGEQRIFNLFKNDLSNTKDWIVLHSLNISKHIRHQYNGECDFVILIPNVGMLCLEVKAHYSISYSEKNGWKLGQEESNRDPINQAKHNWGSLLRNYVTPYDKSIPVAWGIVFTNVDQIKVIKPNGTYNFVNASNFSEYPIIGAEVLNSSQNFFKAVTSIVESFKAHYCPSTVPSSITIEKIEGLTTILRPKFYGIESPKSYLQRTSAEIIHFDEKQYSILGYLSNNERLIFNSFAGTGKTVMALEAAKRKLYEEEESILFITYNKLINKYVANHFPKNKKLVITTIDSLKVSDFATKKFNYLIIDEAQDVVFNSHYLKKIDQVLLNGLSKGNWAWFGDFELQSIFNNSILNDIDILKQKYNATKFNYNQNYRNPNQIIDVCNEIFGTQYVTVRKDEQEAIHISYYSSYEEEQNYINLFIEEAKSHGFSEQDIVILSAKSENVADITAKKINKKFNKNIEIYNLRNKSISSSSIRVFKGLESPIIILTSVDKHIEKEFIYIGLTRALSRIYILGDRQNPTLRTLQEILYKNDKQDDVIMLKPCNHINCEVKDLVNNYLSNDYSPSDVVSNILKLQFENLDILDINFLKSFYQVNKIKIDEIFIEIIITEFIKEFLIEYVDTYISENFGDIVADIEVQGDTDLNLYCEIPSDTIEQVNNIVENICEFTDFSLDGFINYFNKSISPYEVYREISFNFYGDEESTFGYNFQVEYNI